MADEEHVKILRSGVKRWNAWMDENPGVQAKLRGADLSGAKLTDADLRVANLYNATLFDTRLFGADLSDTDLHGANFACANAMAECFGRLYEGMLLHSAGPSGDSE